jgi:hypothetical protein
MRDLADRMSSAFIVVTAALYFLFIGGTLAYSFWFTMTCAKILDQGHNRSMICLEWRKQKSFSETIPPFPFVENWH